MLYSRYGVRAPTEECSLGLLIISLQSIVGVVIQVGTQHISDIPRTNILDKNIYIGKVNEA